jgi:2'-5' RNA ligase
LTRLIVIHELPLAIANIIEQARREVSLQTRSTEALRYPVHLTMRTGMLCPNDMLNQVLQSFLEHCQNAQTIEVFFDSPHCSEYQDNKGLPCGFLGLAVKLDPPLLALHRYLMEYTAYCKDPQKPFQPHVSIAYQDISAAQAKHNLAIVKKIWPELPQSWLINSVSVWGEVQGAWQLFGQAQFC